MLIPVTVRRFLRSTQRAALASIGRCSHAVRRACGPLPPSVRYIVSTKEWSVRQDGLAIMGACRGVAPSVRFKASPHVAGVYETLIHFGSIELFVSAWPQSDRSNRIVVTFFHGYPEMSRWMAEAIELLRAKAGQLQRIVVSCKCMEHRMIQWGFPPDKLVHIPLGVDTRAFRPASPEGRLRSRRRYGVPDDAVCIASFQKDGVGWGEGLEPKLEKGPDIFVEAVERIARHRRVFVLLTGPARGYVKRGLDAAGIPYFHEYLRDFRKLPAFFHAADLYLVTSREEGGPKAVLESMASGVPLVSTKVGMAIDLVRNGENAFSTEIEDVEGIVDAAVKIIDDRQVACRLIDKGLATARGFDWLKIGEQYWRQVYAPVLAARV